MNFDYTYISLFGAIIFEPVTILTNSLIGIYSTFLFLKLQYFKHNYARQWAWFILFIGLGSLFGSIAHGTHYQLGVTFFKTIFYLMNAMSLISVYFCFRAAFTYYTFSKQTYKKGVIYFVIAWISVLLIYTLIRNDFLIIKIHAGIVLIYSLIIHYIFYRKHDKGSGFIVLGIIVSFLSIIVHTLKFSISEYFNYKDISHVIIVISLFIMYKGIKINSEKLNSASLTN